MPPLLPLKAARLPAIQFLAPPLLPTIPLLRSSPVTTLPPAMPPRSLSCLPHESAPLGLPLNATPPCNFGQSTGPVLRNRAEHPMHVPGVHHGEELGGAEVVGPMCCSAHERWGRGED